MGGGFTATSAEHEVHAEVIFYARVTLVTTEKQSTPVLCYLISQRQTKPHAQVVLHIDTKAALPRREEDPSPAGRGISGHAFTWRRCSCAGPKLALHALVHFFDFVISKISSAVCFVLFNSLSRKQLHLITVQPINRVSN